MAFGQYMIFYFCVNLGPGSDLTFHRVLKHSKMLSKSELGFGMNIGSAQTKQILQQHF